MAVRRIAIKWFAVAALLFLPVIARAQNACQPSNQPTMSAIPTLVDPSQVPFAAVTLSASANGNTSGASHTLTVGQSTQLQLNWQARNASSLSAYFIVDNGAKTTWWNNMPISGSYPFFMKDSWTGHTVKVYAVAMEQSGSGSFSPSTQDVVTITVTGQGPGIYHSDGNPTNAYYQIYITYSGTPNIDTNACPNAYQKPITPTAQLQIANITSGEQRNAVSMTGATMTQGMNISASAYDYISVLPGDTITGTLGGVTYCTAVGNIWYDLLSWRIEYAKVIVKDLGHPPRPGADGSAIYDIAPICDNDSDPPDWQPTVVHSFSGRWPYWWGVTSLVRWPDLQGAPWIPLSSFMSDVSDPAGGPLTLAKMVVVGGAVPYPQNDPAFPIPGKCTQFVGFDANGKPIKNVVLTVGSSNLPWWPSTN